MIPSKLLLHIVANLCQGFFLVSCGISQKVVQYDDFSGDVNQPIIFANGWGQNYNYPIIIDLSNAIVNEDSALIAYVQNAINTWNKAIGRTILTLRTGVVTKTGNNFRGLYLPLDDPFRALYYDQISGGSGGWVANTGKKSDIIATTIYTASQGTILNASIRFNRDFFYFGNTQTQYDNFSQSIADMESIALHELGHLLGLGHVINETNSVMYPTIRVGHSTIAAPSYVRCISVADLERIRSIYPGGSASTACINP